MTSIIAISAPHYQLPHIFLSHFFSFTYVREIQRCMCVCVVGGGGRERRFEGRKSSLLPVQSEISDSTDVNSIPESSLSNEMLL